MDVRVRVGLNLQKARRRRGVSQEELAHLAKVHQTYLSGVELGKRNPSIVVLDRIATALGLDLADLTKKRPENGSTS
jgi:transcriptional regulator with XRE-family HTH domain